MLTLVLLRFDSLEDAEDFIDDLDEDIPAAMIPLDGMVGAVTMQ
jgi:hypothetical protein